MPRVLRPSLKVLHTADLHLGNGRHYTASEHETLEGIVRVAKSEAVNVVVIAGDLFDRHEPPPEEVDFALAQLGRIAAPIVLLPGNHDSLEPRSLYHRLDVATLCPNIVLLRDPAGESAEFPGLCLTVWGRPTIDHHPRFRPLADVPQRQGDRWHIGMAHGLCLPDGQDTERSSIIRTSEIASTGWDYLALGHVHGWFDVSAGSVVACYPGPPLRYRSLPENTGFVALVEFDDERGVAVRRVSLD